MRVLFSNNYPTDKLLREVLAGRYPAHHVWGALAFLQSGLEVKCLRYQHWRWLDRLGRKARLGLWVDQQLRAFTTQHRYDVYYSANADTAMLLGRLRNAGLFRRPIVSVFHHPLPRTARVQRSLAGHDKVLCLSDNLRQILEAQFTFRPGQIETVPWGIDHAFFDARRSTQTGSGRHFISAGKSERDFETLAQAFGGIDSELRLFCSGNAAPRTPPPNVRVSFAHAQQCDGNLSFDQLTREYESAFAVCVPLVVPPDLKISMVGLTSLLDAMAFGKPVIMTRNPLLSIDVEKEAIGMYVETGDVAGWRRSISYLRSRPELAEAMGRRARQLCEKSYSVNHFSRAIEQILRNVGTSTDPSAS